MNNLIKENERIDDLQINNLKIIQNNNGFCFGIDSVLLTDFARTIKNNSSIIDLGTGTGIIPILLTAKIKAKKIIGIEIQEDVAEMAQRSITLNNLEEKIEIINGDIKEIDKKFGKGKYDVIITNPPYIKNNTGLKNENNSKLISRHEIECTIEDIARVSNSLLKDKGEVYMVHRPDRLCDIFNVMRENKVEPKEIQLVYSHLEDEANLVLIKGVKCGKPSLKVLKPLIVYNENNEYTEELLKFYDNEES